MVNSCLFISLFFIPSDSLAVDSAQVVETKSVVFVQQESKEVPTIKYQHRQGFFCDFEDKINQRNTLNINIGVGDQ